jgi:alpha-acetolactate decarboxylase
MQVSDCQEALGSSDTHARTRVCALREHGDLGTFEDLDSEMVIVDGHFFQVRCDGSVREVDEAVLSPFAVITRFAPEPAVTLDKCPIWST